MPERELVNTPVPVVQKGRLDIETRSGDFELPIAVSRDWTKPQDDVTRAVIVIPGWPRRIFARESTRRKWREPQRAQLS